MASKECDLKRLPATTSLAMLQNRVTNLQNGDLDRQKPDLFSPLSYGLPDSRFVAITNGDGDAKKSIVKIVSEETSNSESRVSSQIYHLVTQWLVVAPIMRDCFFTTVFRD